MANQFPFYQLKISDRMRKLLGLNYKYRYLYFFVYKGIGYLSSNMIPKHCEVHKIKLDIGIAWLIARIPVKALPYEPTGYQLLNTNGFVIKLLK